MEVKVTIEEKDAVLYSFLLKTNSRTLVFVNSIKAARRVDGLLRVLGVNSRAVHADLQQRQVRGFVLVGVPHSSYYIGHPTANTHIPIFAQRLRAIDSFKSAPVAVLVATDVAARGLGHYTPYFYHHILC
jgi:superfamily II DNA/RNA helicase